GSGATFTRHSSDTLGQRRARCTESEQGHGALYRRNQVTADPGHNRRCCYGHSASQSTHLSRGYGGWCKHFARLTSSLRLTSRRNVEEEMGAAMGWERGALRL